MIAVLPATQLGGRALFNVLIGIYGLWALLSLWRRYKQLDRVTAFFYVALLGAFLLGIPKAVDPGEGIKTWVEFLAPSLAFLVVPLALRESPNAFDRLMNTLALFGTMTLTGLYMLMGYDWFECSGLPFDPKTQLREDQLPFLLPFLLGWFWRHRTGSRRYMGMVSILAAVLGYIIISGGRAAFLGAIVALLVFGKAVLRWRLRWMAILAALVLAITVITDAGLFRRSDLDPNPVNAFTSGRAALWRQALLHSLEQPWVGVGLGNGRYDTKILSFQLGGVERRVQHLHNFLLDVWHETGILGFGTFVGLIGGVFWRLARQWRQLSLRDQQRVGLFLAAALAILATAMLSFSYTSRHFSYLFCCLGALVYLTHPGGDSKMPVLQSQLKS